MITDRETGHKAIFDELERRRVRKRRIDAQPYVPSRADHVEWPLALPGTITLILARAGSKIVSEVEEAIRPSAHGRRDHEIAARILDGIARKDRLKEPWVAKAKAMLAQPVWADLRYGGKTLASALWVPDDVEAVMVVCPYAGGRLAMDDFTLVEHVARGSNASLDAVLLVHTPELSPAERAILRHVSAEEAEQVVGEAIHGDCWECVADYAQYAAAAVVVLTFALLCLEPPDPTTAVDPPPDALDPSAPVGELLALRRAMLDGVMKKLQGS
jgi:hypothetical protein